MCVRTSVELAKQEQTGDRGRARSNAEKCKMDLVILVRLTYPDATARLRTSRACALCRVAWPCVEHVRPLQEGSAQGPTSFDVLDVQLCALLWERMPGGWNTYVRGPDEGVYTMYTRTHARTHACSEMRWRARASCSKLQLLAVAIHEALSHLIHASHHVLDM
jgi:hypothetical protein